MRRMKRMRGRMRGRNWWEGCVCVCVFVCEWVNGEEREEEMRRRAVKGCSFSFLAAAET